MARKQPTQRVFIIRHGERLDNVDYGWVEKAERPYDPPLTDDGVKEALEAGQRFKDKVSSENLILFLSKIVLFAYAIQWNLHKLYGHH